VALGVGRTDGGDMGVGASLDSMSEGSLYGLKEVLEHRQVCIVMELDGPDASVMSSEGPESSVLCYLKAI